jgi:hypothetical protein
LDQNGHEGDLGNIPSLIRLHPNDHEIALGRSLELVHRLVGLYLRNRERVFYMIDDMPPEEEAEGLLERIHEAYVGAKVAESA